MATKTTKTDTALEAVRNAAAAARILTTAEAELRAQHDGLLAERKTIEASYASEAEVIANLNRLVDERAATWAKERAVGIVRDLSPHSDWIEGTTGFRNAAPKLPHWGAASGMLTFPDLCGLAPSLVRARLTEVIHQSGARFGLPAEAKTKRLEEIAAEIETVEAEHLALVDGASECGLKYELLTVVRERREAEALATQRAAELASDRARGVFVVSGV